MQSHELMVATVIEPENRARLDAAVHGCFRALHAETLREAIRTVRERPVRAVLVSPGRLQKEHVPGVADLVRSFPAVPTVAVVARHDARSSQRLLELGASGVSRVVDLCAREGWRELRDLVAEPSTPTAARMLGKVLPALGNPSPDCRHFFDVVIRIAPTTPSVRAIARRFRVRPSTFMSRFFRAGLMSPKRYLAATRLVYAAALFETSGFSISDVAYRLEYSSPQSLGRHLRAITGLTANEFRRRYPFAAALDDFVERLIVPFRNTFRTFHPLQTGVADFGHRR
ncbi:MAG: helix-turn-helix transcriptional regulator [Gemmatimonadetes bacterium]|nr:helix-turn-helix transcriptional regulator [Gemmatimonadota bacterium]